MQTELWKIDLHEFVQQCCLEMHQLFSKISIEEFNSPKYDDPVLCPNLLQLKFFKDRVSYYYNYNFIILLYLFYYILTSI